jgi:hypothetical protein
MVLGAGGISEIFPVAFFSLLQDFIATFRLGNKEVHERGHWPVKC